jgi:hypothetical protein
MLDKWIISLLRIATSTADSRGDNPR